MSRLLNYSAFGVICLLSGLAGCGSSEEPATVQSSDLSPEANDTMASPAGGTPNESVVTEKKGPSVMPVSTGNTMPVSTADASKAADAAPGNAAAGQTPDDDAVRILREIQQLRVAAMPKEVTSLDEAIKARRARNERIVDMATQVLRLTKDDESRKPQFHLAVGQLLEARFQMALAGSREDVETLYEDVQALNERDPKSVAAAEGIYYLAKFSHTRAAQHGKTQPDWFESTSRFAREFADRFPEQTKRAVGLLFAAARTCELHAIAAEEESLSGRLMTESKLCYTALAEKFASTEQGQEATGALRRLSLTGQKLSQFSGPTADGGFVNADEFPGKPTLIYFWDSENEDFASKVLPTLNQIRQQRPAKELRMVGVSLDEDESQMNSFTEANPVPGQQIFFPTAEQRAWNSPLVRFWGIAETPSVWLIDSKGVVVSTHATLERLAEQASALK